MVASVGAQTGQSEDEVTKWRTFWIAIGLACVYSAVHIGARLIASPNLGEDDPLTTIYAQWLDFGYSTNEPPLFVWLTWLVQRITGPSLISFQLLKYGLLIATIGAVYLSAYHVTRNAIWSLITAEALTLIYHVGWRFHEGFAGLIPAMLCSALALLTVFQIVERPRAVYFIWLGLVLGIGLLAQHSFWLVVFAFTGAALIVSDIRGRLFRPMVLVTFAVAIGLSALHYSWIFSDAARSAEFLSFHTAFDNPNPRIDFWKVVRKTVGAPLLFYWSLLLFLLAASWSRVVAHFQTRFLPSIDWSGRPLLQFLGWYAVVAYAVLFLAGVLFSFVNYAYHDLLPLFLPTLVLLFGIVYQVRPSQAEMSRWALISLAIIAFALVGRIANMFIMEPFCSICRWGVPYATLAQQLKTDGFSSGKIITFRNELGGNLRAYFPHSVVSDGGWRAFDKAVRGREATAGAVTKRPPLVLVWQANGRRRIRVSRSALAKHIPRGQSEEVVKTLRAPWRHIYYGFGYRTTVWRYVIIQ
ncbi:MAG: glycosyltransferase family 39 protein [Hyphomicrobiaceae bacterium]